MSYADLGFTIWDGVRVLARRLQDAVYLFAVNTQFDPMQATVRMKSIEGATKAFVVHEGREVPVEGGAITDRFDPYDVRVYRVDKR